MEKVVPLSSAIDLGEQEMEPKNNSLVYEKSKDHAVGLEDAINKFDLRINDDIQTEGEHIIND